MRIKSRKMYSLWLSVVYYRPKYINGVKTFSVNNLGSSHDLNERGKGGYFRYIFRFAFNEKRSINRYHDRLSLIFFSSLRLFRMKLLIQNEKYYQVMFKSPEDNPFINKEK